MSNHNVFKLIHPGAFDDQLTESCGRGRARRLRVRQHAAAELGR